MKTSKIKVIQANGTWKSQHGLLYKFEYEMEDGEVLQVNHKTENSPFEVGQEVEYEIKKTFDWGKIGKIQKPNDFKKGGYDTKGIEVGHAINNAVNMICAGVTFDTVDDSLSTGKKIMEYAQNIMIISERLKNE